MGINDRPDKLLKKFREDAGLLPEELDARAGATPGTAAAIENGRLPAREWLLAVFAQILGVSPHAIDPNIDPRGTHVSTSFAAYVIANAVPMMVWGDLWASVLGRERFRGSIPPNVWDEHARGLEQQGRLI